MSWGWGLLYSTVQYSVLGLGTAIHGLDPELGHVISSRQLYSSPLVRAVLILAGSHIKANDRSLHDITPQHISLYNIYCFYSPLCTSLVIIQPAILIDKLPSLLTSCSPPARGTQPHAASVLPLPPSRDCACIACVVGIGLFGKSKNFFTDIQSRA